MSRHPTTRLMVPLCVVTSVVVSAAMPVLGAQAPPDPFSPAPTAPAGGEQPAPAAPVEPAQPTVPAQPTAETGSTEKKLEDLPLRLTAAADEAQHRWDPLNTGELAKGSGGFNGAMRLTSGGSSFEADEVWEDTTNATYRIKGTLAGMKIERRILVDRQLGAARYLDIIHNRSDEDVEFALSYQIGLAAAAAKIYTSRGKELTGSLGARDFGLAIEAPADAGHPGVLLVLAQERSPNKPKVAVAEDRQSLSLDYGVTVKAGQRAALLHWIMQKEFQGGEGMEERFAPLYAGHRLVAPAVGEADAEMLLNFPADDAEAGGGGADYLVAVNQLSDRLQLEREPGTDKMRVENGSVLSGDATGGELVIASRFGPIEVPVAKVAVLQGGSGRGRGNKVYFRDGTVLSGEVGASGLGLKGGFEVSLEVAQLDYLFYRLGDRDGEFPEGTDMFVKLHTGDVLPIVAAGSVGLGLVSPWGRLAVPMAEIEWLRYIKEPSPRYRVALGDGSLMTVFLEPGDLEVAAGGLGAVGFAATEIAAMWGAEVELPKGFDLAEASSEIPAIPKSLARTACLLSGSNLIVGELADESLEVLTGATVTTVKVADVVRISRAGDGAELSPVFTIELGGGGEITGMLQGRVVEVRSGERSLRVPVQHFLAMRRGGAPEKIETTVVPEEESDDDGTPVRSQGREVILPPPPGF